MFNVLIDLFHFLAMHLFQVFNKNTVSWDIGICALSLNDFFEYLAECIFTWKAV